MGDKRRSQFRWMADWWRSGGGATVRGSTVEFPASGGTTAVNEPAAAWVPAGGIDIHITYRAPVEGVTVSTYVSAFKGPGGQANRLGDGPQTHTWLPQTAQSTDVVISMPINSVVKPAEAVRYRPVIRINGKGLVIEDVAVVPRPISDTVVTWAGAQANGAAGRGARLSAPSIEGDLAVLVMASQWGHTKCRPPAGWEVRATDDVPSGRSGYVAWKRVTAPTDTENLDPWGGQSNGARDRAALLVLSRSEEPEIVPWGPTVPAASTRDRLVFSQLHATSTTEDNEWLVDGGVIGEVGSRSTTASWSSLRMAAGKGAPVLQPGKTEPQGWAALVLGRNQLPRVAVLAEGLREIPARMRAMPWGAKSPEALVARKGFVVAHRGGSASWPEMSMKAYTQSVAYGVHALEVSTHLTQDGVWVCAHDRNLKRVDPSAPETPIAEMTWEAVQRFTTKGEPILRLEQVIEVYGQSHVLVVDPKYSAAQWEGLMSLIVPERTIMKYSFDATWLADAWRARGLKTWGYAYPTHLADGRLAGAASHWDYLGMEYSPDPTVMQRTLQLAAGKPVWGHILSTKGQYDTMLAQGAAGAMVSGVSEVLERKA